MSGLVENTVAPASRVSVEGRRSPGGADPALARNWLVDDAEDRPALICQRDQRAEQRHAADEGFGAVDRVKHPDEFGRLALRAELLADDAVLGEARRDQLAHRRLGGAVGHRHRRPVGLVVDGDPLAEIRADRLSSRVGEVGRERQERV
jgi:hypothetical protein